MTTQAATREQDTDPGNEDESLDDLPEDPPENEDADDGEPDDGDTADEPKPENDEDAPLTVNLADDEETEDEEAPPPADDPKAAHRWKELKAAEKKAKALERELAELKALKLELAKVADRPRDEASSTVKKPGPRPTLKDVDHDEGAYADALLKWGEETKAFEAEERKTKAEQEDVNAAYWEKVTKLGRPDYKDAEKTVDLALSPTQAAILLRKTKDTATLVYALAKSPVKLAKLAALADPLDFHAALRDLEKTMLVTKRKPSTLPESVVRGGGGTAPDQELQRLEAIADRTGNRAPIQRYKEKLAERQKKK